MIKVIGLSIFGYNNKHDDCHSFDSFIRFLSITLRAYNTLFWDWKIYLAVDKESYTAYQGYFDFCKNNNIIQYLDIIERKELCRNMLWRCIPISFADYTICRDIDSLPTVRERQAVDSWIKNDTLAHSINDSVGHNIPLLGGMIGFKKNVFNLSDVDSCGIDYRIKGSDQTYLNVMVFPKISNSITEHRVIGMPVRHENPYSYNHIQNTTVDITNCEDEHVKEFYSNPDLLNRCNLLVNHVGCGGFHLEKHYNDILDRHYEGAVPFWTTFSKKELNNKLTEIENEYPEVFYWVKKIN